MRTVDYQELKEIIKNYVDSSLITSPLLISFDRNEGGSVLHIIKELFGASNFYKIGDVYDNPRSDIPYCLYEMLQVDENTISILKRCVSISQSIHRPVFCVIANNYINKLPEGIISPDYIFSYKE